MKKQIIGFFAVLILPVVFFGCKDTVEPGIMPLSIKNAIDNAPEDVLVGLGNPSGFPSLSQARNVAASRARAEIALQIQTMIKKMVEDFEASNIVDHNDAISLEEHFTIALSTSSLPGSFIEEEVRDPEGLSWKPEFILWSVVYMKKADVKAEIDSAVTAAKTAVPTMASFDADVDFDNTFAWVKARK